MYVVANNMWYVLDSYRQKFLAMPLTLDKMSEVYITQKKCSTTVCKTKIKTAREN